MPIATTVTCSIAVPRRQLYAWLVPGVFYNELHTVIRDAAGLAGVAKTSGTTGPWDKPGSYRTVHLSDGNTLREEVTAATTPDYFAYKLNDFSHPIVKRLLRGAGGQWWFTDEGGGTHVKWTYAVEPASALASLLLVPLVRFQWRRYMQAAMDAIKSRAEKEGVGATR
jgi:polyketide cyclase/dehydrase/lipid transport protein